MPNKMADLFIFARGSWLAGWLVQLMAQKPAGALGMPEKPNCLPE